MDHARNKTAWTHWIPTTALRPALLYAAWLGLFFFIFFQSWVSEDAYITFRVIDNFVNGYGLRWNIAERVQIYTHPLWLLLHLPFAFFWPNLFQLNIALSLFCSSLAVAIVLLTFRKSAAITLVCFMLPLYLSKAFIDYSGSGLETSLSFLLFAMLGYALIHWQQTRFFPLALSLIGALLLLNRLDHLLLIGPLFVFLCLPHIKTAPKMSTVIQCLCGALPLLSWFLFALFYYGFVFPNTKYAKLDTGLPLSDYLWQGFQYSFIWITQDTASVLVLCAALTLGMRSRLRIHQMLAAGILLNIAYVFYIGGDYMMGRFYAVILFAACWLLLASAPARIRPDILFTATIALLLAYATSYFVRDIRNFCDACFPMKGRVLDARRIFGSNSLFTSYWPPRIRLEGQYKFRYDGEKLALEDPPPVKSLTYVGMLGYYAGPNVRIIDELALGDALLARLPAMENRQFHVGHYRRAIPKGYLDAITTGELTQMNPNLARYYEKLRLITQGDLWDSKRLETILRFQFRQYDGYRNAFLTPTTAR